MSVDPSTLPLSGTLVVDVSRMLPGAVLVRSLIDLGARVIKVEDPEGGDPMRSTPPIIDGLGVGFHTFFHGVESVTFDLRDPASQETVLKLSRHADVFVESFRPGTLEGWNLGLEKLRAVNPGLITVSLSSYGPSEPWARHVGHDLNFTAGAGLLGQLGSEGVPPGGVPPIQFADVAAGLLSVSSILGALLVRQKSGRGLHIDQPLAASVLPFVAWNLAEASAKGSPFMARVLAGESPCYRRYRCAEGTEIALGALEPKFWSRFVDLLGLPELAGDGLLVGEAGKPAFLRVEEKLSKEPASHWVALGEREGLPIASVRSLEEVLTTPYFRETGRLREVPTGGAARLEAPACFVSPFRRAPARAPALGENQASVLSEFGLTEG